MYTQSSCRLAYSWWTSHLQAPEKLPLESGYAFALDLAARSSTACSIAGSIAGSIARSIARSIALLQGIGVCWMCCTEFAWASSPDLHPGSANVKIDVFWLCSGWYLSQMDRMISHCTDRLRGQQNDENMMFWSPTGSVEFLCDFDAGLTPSLPSHGSVEPGDSGPSESFFLQTSSFLFPNQALYTPQKSTHKSWSNHEIGVESGWEGGKVKNVKRKCCSWPLPNSGYLSPWGISGRSSIGLTSSCQEKVQQHRGIATVSVETASKDQVCLALP